MLNYPKGENLDVTKWSLVTEIDPHVSNGNLNILKWSILMGNGMFWFEWTINLQIIGSRRLEAEALFMKLMQRVKAI